MTVFIDNLNESAELIDEVVGQHYSFLEKVTDR